MVPVEDCPRVGRRASLSKTLHCLAGLRCHLATDAGAPHLARFSRDVGSHCARPETLHTQAYATCVTAPYGCPSHQRCPDFLLRSTSHDRACGFLSKKAARSCSTPPTSTGNPGYVGRIRRGEAPTIALRVSCLAQEERDVRPSKRPNYSRTVNGLTAPTRGRGFTHTGMANSGIGFEVKNLRV